MPLLVGAVVACSSSPPAEEAAQEPVLEGAYYTPDDGAIAWTAFKGDQYVTWSSEPSCSTAPSPACERRGTFVVDAEAKTLTLTDSRTGEVSARHFEVQKTHAQGALVGMATPRSVGLVEAPSQLIRPNQVTQFGLTDSSKSGPLVVADVRQFLFASCMLIDLLVTGDMSRPPARPPPPPPPVVSISECPKKKS